MSRWKYNGPDRDLPGFGKVGHTSVIEATGTQIADFGGTFFEKLGDKALVSIVPWGSVPFVPDVTGLNQAESEEARRLAVVEDTTTTVGPDGETQEARRIRIEEDRREAALGHREFIPTVITVASLTQAQIENGAKRGLTPEQVVSELTAAQERDAAAAKETQARVVTTAASQADRQRAADKAQADQIEARRLEALQRNR
jgi:hypothetical protein